MDMIASSLGVAVTYRSSWPMKMYTTHASLCTCGSVYCLPSHMQFVNQCSVWLSAPQLLFLCSAQYMCGLMNTLLLGFISHGIIVPAIEIEVLQRGHCSGRLLCFFCPFLSHPPVLPRADPASSDSSLDLWAHHIMCLLPERD